jgi:hypothetical protein
MKYVAKPLVIFAFQIESVLAHDATHTAVTFNDRPKEITTNSDLGGCVPKPGDFFCIQDDKTKFILPRAIFEARYEIKKEVEPVVLAHEAFINPPSEEDKQ